MDEYFEEMRVKSGREHLFLVKTRDILQRRISTPRKRTLTISHACNKQSDRKKIRFLIGGKWSKQTYQVKVLSF